MLQTSIQHFLFTSHHVALHLVLTHKLFEFDIPTYSDLTDLSTPFTTSISLRHHFVHHSHTSLLAVITRTSPIVPHHDQPQHYHALRKVPQRNFSPPAHCDPHVAALVAILASPVIILQRSVQSRTHTTLRVNFPTRARVAFASHSHASK